MSQTDELTGKFESLSGKILQDSRNELCFELRYLSPAICALTPQVNTELRSIGTDGIFLAVHPKVLLSLFEQDRRLVNRIYLHEVFHCLFRHIFKPLRLTPARGAVSQLPAQTAGVVGVGATPTLQESTQGCMAGEQSNAAGVQSSEVTDQTGGTAVQPASSDLWDLACDMAVEFLIDDTCARSVRMGRSVLQADMRQRLLREVKVLNAESIFKALSQMELTDRFLARLRAEFCVDDHSLWPSHQDIPKDSPKMPEIAILRKKWEDLSGKTVTMMEADNGERGSGGGGYLEQTKVENREKYDYKAFLRKFACLREECTVDPDSFDYIFYSFGFSLYGNMPLIEPQETREVRRIEDFVVVIDVSMSVSGSLVRSFLEQTYSVLTESETYLRKINVHIIQCDETIRSDVKITSREELDDYMEKFELTGQGGTDFRPAFEYVNGLLEKKEFQSLRGLIYFTDGKGIYPKRKPPYESAFVFMEKDYQDRDVPPWAIRLVLMEDEIQPQRELDPAQQFIWDEQQR